MGKVPGKSTQKGLNSQIEREIKNKVQELQYCTEEKDEFQVKENVLPNYLNLNSSQPKTRTKKLKNNPELVWCFNVIALT